MVTIYLAGPIKNVPGNGMAWRREVEIAYENEVYNPLYHIDGVENDVSPAEIVETDKEAIDESDGVLVGYMSDIESVGTPMEVLYAYNQDTPVALWIRDGTTPADLSYWYRHHTFPTQDRDKAIAHLERQQ